MSVSYRIFACCRLTLVNGDAVVDIMAGVASECDLCVVHNAEANAWRDYIVQLVSRFVANKGASPLRLRSIDDSSLTKSGRTLPRSAIIVVVLSPAHLSFLRCHQHVSYKSLVDTRATDALVLRCGIAYFDDLASQDSAVFSQFFGWTKLDDVNNGEPVTRAVARLLSNRPQVREEPYANLDTLSPSRSSGDRTRTPRTSDDELRSRRFRVIPTTIRCEVRSLRIHTCRHNENFDHLTSTESACLYLKLKIIIIVLY